MLPYFAYHHLYRVIYCFALGVPSIVPALARGQPTLESGRQGSTASHEEDSDPATPGNQIGTSPFLDGTIGVSHQSGRFSTLLGAGLQAGLYISGRLRLGLMGSLITFDPERGDVDGARGSSAYSERPVLFYGGSVGFALAQTPGFVWAPGIMLTQSNVSDYGTAVAMHLPFDWITKTRTRFGFALGLGATFGGTYGSRECSYDRTTGSETCGAVVYADRPPGSAIFAYFNFGFGSHAP